jgi:hypothetical protein
MMANLHPKLYKLYILIGIMTFGLSVASYNSNGLGAGRVDYIKRIIKDFDVIFLQEHWMFDDAIGGLEDQLNDHLSISNKVCVYGVSGMESNTLLYGRPFGGVAIIWKRNLKCFTCTNWVPENCLC